MASDILTADINELYPVAGKDNDSQGFRDNFKLIKTGLTTAASEITTLQTNTAKLDATNDFNGNNISEANFIANSEEVFVTDEISFSQKIRFINGHYQIITVGENTPITLTLTDWPATGKLGKMRLAVKGDGSTPILIEWSTGASGVLKTDTAWPENFIADSASDPIIIDFWSADAGLTVYGQYHGQFT